MAGGTSFDKIKWKCFAHTEFAVRCIIYDSKIEAYILQVGLVSRVRKPVNKRLDKVAF